MEIGENPDSEEKILGKKGQKFMAKISISINENLLQRLDNYADANYTTRSGIITTACTQYLTQSEAISSVRSMGLAMKKIADTGTVDAATLDKLKEFELVCNLIVNGQ